MVVLESTDADADAAAFAAAGIAASELVGFEREGQRPTAAPSRSAFRSRSRATPMAPEIGFFTCRQRYPENFWNPALQQHPNTVSGIAGAVLVAEEPHRPSHFPVRLRRRAELLATSSGITAQLRAARSR